MAIISSIVLVSIGVGVLVMWVVIGFQMKFFFKGQKANGGKPVHPDMSFAWTYRGAFGKI